MRDKINVLVADDDQVVRDFFYNLLAAEGVSALTAIDGFKAVEIAKENPIDLAFLDIRMPGMDGVKVYEQLKRKNPSLACVFITAYAMEADLLEKVNQEGITVLKKPFQDIRQIQGIIEENKKKILSQEAEGIAEKRLHVRLDMTLEVDYKIKGIAQEQFNRSLGKNISLGGIRLLMQEELKPGTILELAIKVPGHSESYHTYGEVVWNQGATGANIYYITGIKFMDADLSKLAALIMQCAK